MMACSTPSEQTLLKNFVKALAFSIVNSNRFECFTRVSQTETRVELCPRKAQVVFLHQNTQLHDDDDDGFRSSLLLVVVGSINMCFCQ